MKIKENDSYRLNRNDERDFKRGLKMEGDRKGDKEGRK